MNFPKAHNGGITSSEAIVFWLGGLSSDPNYPISGNGGPSYVIPKHNDINNHTLDPIDSRQGAFPFEVTRLGPRGPDGYFAETEYNHIEYFVNGQWHRINFWHYSPRKSEQPYIYFDVSRGTPAMGNDVPAVFAYGVSQAWMYPIKTVHRRDAQGVPLSFKYANEGKFQILHCGIDSTSGVMQLLSCTSIHRKAKRSFRAPNTKTG